MIPRNRDGHRLLGPGTAVSASSLSRVATIGTSVAVVLIALAIAIPAITGADVNVQYFPPLHADWRPRLGWGTVPAVVLAIVAARYAVDLATRLPWRLLLLTSFVAGAAWMISLALVDGLDGIGVILGSKYEYLQTARATTDIGVLLRDYVSRIPLSAPDTTPVHIAGHPPGAVLFFIALVRMGLGSGLAAGFVVTIVAATTAVAVLVTLRRLGQESAARRAAPFLVLGSAAIWMAVSADAMFGAVAAWGLCCLAFAATAQSRTGTASWGIVAGLLLGYCVMLSYGLPVLGLIAIAILVLARHWRPLAWAVPAAVAVVLAFAVGGFRWWEAYPVLVQRYWDGAASERPAWYWNWANLAALAFSAGPIVGASVAVAIRRATPIRAALSNPAITLTLAAAAIIAVVDLSQMSRAEVERIWLPFVPWLLIGTALLPERWRRWGLGAQLGFALVVQHLLFTGW